jgi:hypothetical protein
VWPEVRLTVILTGWARRNLYSRYIGQNADAAKSNQRMMICTAVIYEMPIEFIKNMRGALDNGHYHYTDAARFLASGRAKEIASYD